MQSSDKTRGEWDIPGSENTGKGKQEEKKMALFQAFRAVRRAREGSAGGSTSLRCSEQGGGQGDRGK